MDILSNLAELTDERLAEYAAEVRAAFQALADLDVLTEAASHRGRVPGRSHRRDQHRDEPPQ